MAKAPAPAPKPSAPPPPPVVNDEALNGGTGGTPPITPPPPNEKPAGNGGEGTQPTPPPATQPDAEKSTQPQDAAKIKAVDADAPGALEAVKNGAAIVGIDNPHASALERGEGRTEFVDYNVGFVKGFVYTGPLNDRDAFDDTESDAYKEGFRAGALKTGSAYDKSTRAKDPSFDRDGDGHPGGSLSKEDRLKYDDGYNIGYTQQRTGVTQVAADDPRMDDKQFRRGVTKGATDAAAGDGVRDSHIASADAIAAEREQQEVIGMSVEDRLLRIERALGMRSPKKE